jgi:Glucose-regulated metallo-peptidase M90
MNANTSSLCLIACLLGVQVGAQEVPAEKTSKQPSTEDRFAVLNLEGWTIFTNREVPKQHPEETAKTMAHLRWELYQITLAAPATAVRNLQENNAIWIEYDEKVSLSYHPGRSWLIERGYTLPRDPESFMSLSVKNHLGDSYRHPFVVFHEFAHGYDAHFNSKGDGYGNRETIANYERMMKEGKYEKVKLWDGRIASHYARTNHMEYWAESSEAYFAVNDFYPFVRAELREHDPKMVQILERYWGVDPEHVVKLEKDLVAYQLQIQQSANQSERASDPATATKYTPTAQYTKRDIDDWHVNISPQLVAQPGLCETMVTLLNYKLHMIDHFIAEPGRKQLHEIPIWLEVGQAGPYIRYCNHGENNGPVNGEAVNPDKFGAVEIRDAHSMQKWAMIEQSDMLHALALAYYDRYATKPDSELAKKIQAAYENAKKDDGFKSVLRFDGQRVPHPGLVSEKQYFAELMESYFLVNDHYPFIRCELKDQDSAGYAIIAGLWEGNPRR